MAGKGQEIPSFSDLQKQSDGNSDDPFSSYNASKASDDDPFASYNAKKSSEIARASSTERPNITISVPMRNKHDEIPSKMRRVHRSDSRERDALRIEVKRPHERSHEIDRRRSSERSRDRRDDRYDSRSHRGHDRDYDRHRRRDHRYDERRYDERRHGDHREERRRHDSGSRENRREKPPPEPPAKVDINELRKVPAFRQQEEPSEVHRERHEAANRPPYLGRPEPHASREHWSSYPQPHWPQPVPYYGVPFQHYPERPHQRPHEVAPYPPPHPVPYREAQPPPPPLPPQSDHDQRSRPQYLQPEQLPPDRILPPHIEHKLQRPEHRPEPYPHWERSQPPPLDPPAQHYDYHHRDRFGPIPGSHPYHRDRAPPPPPVKIPDISDVAEIMKGLKESATKNLESTKELITTLLPPKPAAPEEKPVDESKLPPRLGDSNYSSAAVTYKEPTPPPPKPRPPVKKGKDYTSMFSKTANMYKSNWVKTPEKDEKASGSKDSAENERVIKLSGSLEVDLDEVNESQVNLLAKYLKFRTRGLRVVADNLPLRVKKQSENDDDDSALETVKSVRRAFNTKPAPIPGTMSCDLCKKYNLPPDEYRRHINSDFHCWMDGSWKHKLPGYLPRFSMVWCTICRDFFMITFEGNTVLGHEDKDDHKKNKSVYRLQYDDVPSTKFCLLSELRTTKVKMPTPLKCKYFTPREALESYKANYSRLCDRNLVVD